MTLVEGRPPAASMAPRAGSPSDRTADRLRARSSSRSIFLILQTVSSCRGYRSARGDLLGSGRGSSVANGLFMPYSRQQSGVRLAEQIVSSTGTTRRAKEELMKALRMVMLGRDLGTQSGAGRGCLRLRRRCEGGVECGAGQDRAVRVQLPGDGAQLHGRRRSRRLVMRSPPCGTKS